MYVITQRRWMWSRINNNTSNWERKMCWQRARAKLTQTHTHRHIHAYIKPLIWYIIEWIDKLTDACMREQYKQQNHSKKHKKTTEKKQQRTEIKCSMNEQRCHWIKFSWCLVADRASAVFNSRINRNNNNNITKKNLLRTTNNLILFFFLWTKSQRYLLKF